MAVTFILGRAGSGKTRACLDAILSELARPDETRRLILLVPEQASFQMERALATRAPRRGYSRAAVLSFTRLARQVIDQTGFEPELLSPRARVLGLRCVVARCGDELPVLRDAARANGFYVQLDRVIEELLREDVSPDALRAAAAQIEDGGAAGKVQEVARLYAEYLAWLGPQRTDVAARLAVLRERLEGLGWLREASIWVDGFAGFTGQELETLVALSRTARDVTITLLLDPAGTAVRLPRQTPDPLGLFHRTEITYQRLLRLFEDAGVQVTPPVNLHPLVLPRFTQAPTLAALEAGLATPRGAEEGVSVRTAARAEARGSSVSTPPPMPAISLHECTTHREELRAAARWIRTRIADSGGELRFRDFAVIARDLEPFAPMVAEVFAEYEIPYFLDRRRAMRAHPLSRLPAALFEAVATDFDVPPMVRLLRTRLLPLTRDEAEQLENIIVNDAVRGLTLWQQPRWEFEHARGPADAFGEQRARIVAAIEPLLTLARSEASSTGAAWARTLHQVLEGLGVRRQVETWIADARAARRWESAEMHRLAWEGLCGVLEDMHAVLGDTRLSAGDAASIVGSALEEMTLGMAPPTVDQVLVSAIERSRHPDIKYAWVFAFNEGVFPARPAEDKLLSTRERQALMQAGLAAPASHSEDAFGERLLAYIALTRPSLGLTISYATVADDGEPLLLSPLLDDVLRALPGLAPTRAREDEPPVCLTELARGYLAARGEERWSRQRRRYKTLCEQLHTNSPHAGRLRWLLRGLHYENDPQPVGNYRSGGVGYPSVEDDRRAAVDEVTAVWNGSPSELETYLQCPFKHFARYGLRLDPARGPRPLRWDLGSVAHEILADVTRRAMREPGGVRALADRRWQELLGQAVQDFWQRQPADLAQRRPDYVFMGEVLAALLRDLVAAHAARWRRGCFEPLCCEQAFDPSGAKDALPGVELKLADGRRVGMHGKIDRVDVCRYAGRTLVLVYDYKSGTGSVRSDVLTGGRLQLFVYLLAVEQALAGEETVRPAGVFFAPLYPDLGVLDNQYAAEAGEQEQLMYMFRPRGLFDEVAGQLLDEQLGAGPSPVAQMRLKKDGGFYKNSDAVPAAEIEQRLELAQQTALLAAEGIARGAIEVAPLVESRTLACGWCEFQPVCRFDRAFNRPRAAEHVLPHLSGEQSDEGGPT